tara:strand:- start:264 stop:566 length:303 start_codon:yes stop_codon:yes gene_type:complete
MIWKINTLEYTNDSDKGVVIAHWCCSKTDGDYTGSCYGACSFSPDPGSESYIAYESLTKDDVFGWIHEQVSKDETESKVQAQIDAQANPTTMNGVPSSWT